MNTTVETQSLTFDEHSREALYGFAWMLLESQRTNDAMNAFRVLVRFAPTDERGWLGLGSCHELCDQSEIAAELYGAGSLASAPPSSRCLVALARLKRRDGDSSEADAILDEAFGLASDQDDEAMQSCIVEERGAR